MQGMKFGLMCCGLTILVLARAGMVLLPGATSGRVPDGTYVGYVPCRNGDGIKNILHIADHHYRMRTVYLRPDEGFLSTGRVINRGNNVIEMGKGSGLCYEVNDHGLRQLDANGNRPPRGTPCAFVRTSGA